MEEVTVLRRKSKKLFIVAGGLLIVLGILVYVFMAILKPKVVSPVQESGNVRIIFVTPQPPTLEVKPSSPSATPKNSGKAVPTPKATPKTSPKASIKSASDSAN